MTENKPHLFEHVQSSPASTWTITHSLGTNSPVVDIFVDYEGSLQRMLAKITPVSVNACTIEFSSPMTGRATIS